MSKEKEVPPIQPEPFRPFTLRLVKGRFVRVPRIGAPAQTDATRPPTKPPQQKTLPYGDGSVVGRNLRLVDGHFVSDADQPSEPTAVPEDVDERNVEFLDRRQVIPEFRPAE